MNQLEFYKEQYFKELETKDSIENSLATPIGITTGLIAGLFYLVTNFEYDFKSLNTISSP